MFKRVKGGVYKKTYEKQRPWTHDDIIGSFYFKLPSKGTAAKVIPKLKQKKETKKAKPAKAKTKTYPLTINTQPADAKVSITNIKPRYKDGILLKPGNYKIKVSKKGYKTKYLTATLNKQPLEIKVLLGIEISIKDKTKPKHQKLKNGEQKFWDMVIDANTLEYYEFYLEDYPNGYYAYDAKRFISQEEERKKTFARKKIQKKYLSGKSIKNNQVLRLTQ